jgi:hypothetical protein
MSAARALPRSLNWISSVAAAWCGVKGEDELWEGIACIALSQFHQRRTFGLPRCAFKKKKKKKKT